MNIKNAMNYLEGISNTEENKNKDDNILKEQSPRCRINKDKINTINSEIEQFNREYQVFRQQKVEESIHSQNRKDLLKRSKNYYDIIYILM